MHEGEWMMAGTRPDLARCTRAGAWGREGRLEVVVEAIPHGGVVCAGWRERFPSMETLDFHLKTLDFRAGAVVIETIDAKGSVPVPILDIGVTRP
jgi:hypothetical protein